MFSQGWSLPLLEGVGDKALVLATCSRKTAASHSVLPLASHVEYMFTAQSHRLLRGRLRANTTDINKTAYIGAANLWDPRDASPSTSENIGIGDQVYCGPSSNFCNWLSFFSLGTTRLQRTDRSAVKICELRPESKVRRDPFHFTS